MLLTGFLRRPTRLYSQSRDVRVVFPLHLPALFRSASGSKSVLGVTAWRGFHDKTPHVKTNHLRVPDGVVDPVLDAVSTASTRTRDGVVLQIQASKLGRIATSLTDLPPFFLAAVRILQRLLIYQVSKLSPCLDGRS